MPSACQRPGDVWAMPSATRFSLRSALKGPGDPRVPLPVTSDSHHIPSIPPATTSPICSRALRPLERASGACSGDRAPPGGRPAAAPPHGPAAAAMPGGPGGPRGLYRRLLRLHRALPPALRELGDRYVREEFRRHRAVGPAEAQRFLREWEASA